jgi:hypothetical protein
MVYKEITIEKSPDCNTMSVCFRNDGLNTTLVLEVIDDVAYDIIKYRKVTAKIKDVHCAGATMFDNKVGKEITFIYSIEFRRITIPDEC